MIAARQRVKLLLDEGLPKRQSFPHLNNRCDLAHIRHDYRKAGSRDEKVYALATVNGRIVITLNVYDFQRLLKKDGSSVIGLSLSLTKLQIDTKLVALIRRLQPQHLTGQFFKIDRDTKVRDLI